MGLRPARALAVSGALVLLLLAVSGHLSVRAQERAKEILRQEAGPYRLAVAASSAQPFPGHLYLWVSLADAATSQPVVDAQVRILAQRTTEAGESALALHAPAAPGTYVADILLDQPGTWRLAFEVDGPLGAAQTALDLEVQKTPRNQWLGNVGWAVVLGILAAGALYLWWRTRRSLSRSRRSP